MSSPKIPKIDLAGLKGGNDDLMKRLGNFLPQMAAANEKLDKEMEGTKSSSIQIDAVLKKATDVDDDDDQSQDSDHDDENEAETSKPKIEMTVALGDFDSNPIMSALAGSDDDSDLGNEETNVSDENEKQTQNSTVLKLLEDKNLEKNGSKDDSPLLSVRSTRRISNNIS